MCGDRFFYLHFYVEKRPAHSAELLENFVIYDAVIIIIVVMAQPTIQHVSHSKWFSENLNTREKRNQNGIPTFMVFLLKITFICFRFFPGTTILVIISTTTLSIEIIETFVPGFRKQQRRITFTEQKNVILNPLGSLRKGLLSPPDLPNFRMPPRSHRPSACIRQQGSGRILLLRYWQGRVVDGRSTYPADSA